MALSMYSANKWMERFITQRQWWPGACALLCLSALSESYTRIEQRPISWNLSTPVVRGSRWRCTLFITDPDLLCVNIQSHQSSFWRRPHQPISSSPFPTNVCHSLWSQRYARPLPCRYQKDAVAHTHHHLLDVHTFKAPGEYHGGWSFVVSDPCTDARDDH